MLWLRIWLSSSSKKSAGTSANCASSKTKLTRSSNSRILSSKLRSKPTKQNWTGSCKNNSKNTSESSKTWLLKKSASWSKTANKSCKSTRLSSSSNSSKSSNAASNKSSSGSRTKSANLKFKS